MKLAMHPKITITPEMLEEAQRLIPQTRVNRTVASPMDTLAGHLGEFAFAAYFFDDWRRHNVGQNKGETDFGDVEIKTSAYPFSEKLHLLVREDYAKKRKPAAYVQVIIDLPSPQAAEILPGTTAILCGFADAAAVDAAPKKDFGSKFGSDGGYLCHFIRIDQLRPMAELAAFLKTYHLQSTHKSTIQRIRNAFPANHR